MTCQHFAFDSNDAATHSTHRTSASDSLREALRQETALTRHALSHMEADVERFVQGCLQEAETMALPHAPAAVYEWTQQGARQCLLHRASGRVLLCLSDAAPAHHERLTQTLVGEAEMLVALRRQGRSLQCSSLDVFCTQSKRWFCDIGSHQVVECAFADKNTLLFIAEDSTHRPHELWQWTRQGGAQRMYQESDRQFFLSFDRLRDGTLLLQATSKNTSETWLVTAARLQPTLGRRAGIRYQVLEGQLVLTNENAPWRRLLSLSTREERVPEIPGYWLEQVTTGGTGFLLTYHHQGASALLWFPNEGTPLELLSADVRCQVTVEVDACESDIVMLQLTSFTAPPRQVRLDLSKPLVPLCVEQAKTSLIEVRSSDHVNVPLTLLEAGGAAVKPRPTVLVVYGAYGVSLRPQFSLARQHFLQAGGAVALAHVRGGGELGPAWHAAGRRELKTNSLDDVLACLTWLKAQGRTVGLWGTSAGAVLAAAAANHAPSMVDALALEIPFLAVRKTMSTPEAALQSLDVLEWGVPSEPAVDRALSRYDPFDSLPVGRYPSVLVLTAQHDFRAPAEEALDWAHRCRERTGAQVHLSCDEESGHSGGQTIEAEFRRLALIYTFLLNRLGGPPSMCGQAPRGLT
jgi:oligopeptidase B